MARRKIPELKVEPVSDKLNHHILSLIEYRREEYLCIIDSITPDEIGAYVLDYADQEGIYLAEFIVVAMKWYYTNADKYPLSVELSKLGIADKCSVIYRSFDTACVSRIVGRVFEYESKEKPKLKRRRANPIPESITIKFKPQAG